MLCVWRSDRAVTGPKQEKLPKDENWGGGLYVKAGAAIPTWPVRHHIERGWSKELIYEVYAGADGESTLYEDDGISLDYRKGGSFVAHTKLTVKDAAEGTTFAIGPRVGGGFAGDRTVTVRFHGLTAAPTAATVAGKPVEGTWCEKSRVYTVGPFEAGAGGATVTVK